MLLITIIYTQRREFIETVARKLRAVVREYGEKALFGVSIACGNENINTVCGFHHYFSPGLSAPILILRQLPELLMLWLGWRKNPARAEGKKWQEVI